MPAWNELVNELTPIPGPELGPWLVAKQNEWLRKLRIKRGDRNVIFYASAFLQKPAAPAMFLQISPEDINGLMSVMHGMDWSKHLTLVLHTPGGVTNATETIVEYLLQKFTRIEVIVPTFAMSGGTMVSLAADNIVMGRQSQLGPIDAQMPVGGRSVSARAIVEQFEEAQREILGDTRRAAVWAAILQSLGPALLVEAKNALDYGEHMVARWLGQRMFRADQEKADSVAAYFNRAQQHRSHGRRIDRNEARSQGLQIEDLETDADLQDVVLTNYHLATLIFEKSPAVKFIASDNGQLWVKSLAPVGIG
jgi:Serine dehydrogenase proteinase